MWPFKPIRARKQQLKLSQTTEVLGFGERLGFVETGDGRGPRPEPWLIFADTNQPLIVLDNRKIRNTILLSRLVQIVTLSVAIR
jgi:hypothetical protein